MGSAPAEARPSAAAAVPHCILFEAIGRRRLVARCCRRSVAAGVRAGMDVAHARALLPAGRDGLAPDLVLHPFEPLRERAALASLARWATRYTPAVAPDEPTPDDEPDSLLLDLTGCDRLFHGEHRLLRLLLRGVRGLGLRARVACGPSVGWAWAMARFGPDDLTHAPADTSPGQILAALRPLPVAALRVGRGCVAALAAVGVHAVGDVLNLPRAALPSRYGPQLVLRIDQALGQAIEPVTPVRTADVPTVERRFAGPTPQLEAIQGAAWECIAGPGGLVAQLDARQLGACALELTLHRADLAPVVLQAALSRPAREPRHLWSLLRPQVERAHLGFGVEGLTLAAPRVGRLRHDQRPLRFGSGPSGSPLHVARIGPAHLPGGPAAPALMPRQAGELLDTLASRLGPGGVLRMQPLASHLPERAQRFVPAGNGPLADAAQAPLVAWPRPTFLLDRPEPVGVVALVPDGPPLRLRWRGREVECLHAAGPERLGAEWWRAGGGAAGATPEFPSCLAASLAWRDYFRVHTDAGPVLWIFREEPAGTWFVHGLWT